MHEYRLHGFLGCLRCVEAEVLEEHVGQPDVRMRPSEVAAGPSQPLLGVIASRSFGAIHYSALPQRRGHDAPYLVPQILDVLRSDDQHVDWNWNTEQAAVDFARESPPMLDSGLDDEQVQVTIGAHLTANRGTEENDLIRLGDVDDTSNDLGKERIH